MQKTLLPGIAVLAVLALLITAPSHADRQDKKRCEKIAEDIRRIESRMRQPYTAAQGVRLEERLRRLKLERYRRCR